MLQQLWLTGVLVAFSVFGVKVGLGLGAYVLERRASAKNKAVFIGGSLSMYLLLFMGMYLVVTRLNLLNHLDKLVNLLGYGMTLHLLVAVGLFAWGLQLLLQNTRHAHGFAVKASLLLIAPCPVCATVILLNLTMAYSLLPLAPLAVTLMLCGLFYAIILLTFLLMLPFKGRIRDGNHFLGGAMALVSLYFFFTVLIAPIYPEIKAAFAMAVSNNPVNNMDPTHTAILIAVVLLLMGTGFLKTHFKKGVAH